MLCPMYDPCSDEVGLVSPLRSRLTRHLCFLLSLAELRSVLLALELLRDWSPSLQLDLYALYVHARNGCGVLTLYQPMMQMSCHALSISQ